MTSLAQLLAKEGFKNKSKLKSRRPAWILPNGGEKGVDDVTSFAPICHQECRQQETAEEDEAAIAAAVRADARLVVIGTKDGSRNLLSAVTPPNRGSSYVSGSSSSKGSTNPQSSTTTGRSHVMLRKMRNPFFFAPDGNSNSKKELSSGTRYPTTTTRGIIRTASGSVADKEKRTTSIHPDATRRRVPAPHHPEPPPAIHEAAVGAVISACTSYIRPYFLLSRQDSRAPRPSLRQACHSCFLRGLIQDQEDAESDTNGVIANLIEAMDVVDMYIRNLAGKEHGIQKEVEVEQGRCTMQPKHTGKGVAVPQSSSMQRATLQLTVIGEMSSHDDLRAGSTSGVPNSYLAACAHLYLAVLYYIQGKPSATAKSLLEAFCDAPTPARTGPLRGLWEYLIAPHLSHLKQWYLDAQAGDRPTCGFWQTEPQQQPTTTTQNWDIRLWLDKVYNEALDGGTYLLALYYKQWLMTTGDPMEGPGMPTVPMPRLPGTAATNPAVTETSIFSRPPSSRYSLDGRATYGSTSSTVASPSASMMSKTLYCSIVSRSRGTDSFNSNDLQQECVTASKQDYGFDQQCSDVEATEHSHQKQPTASHHLEPLRFCLDPDPTPPEAQPPASTNVADKQMGCRGTDPFLSSFPVIRSDTSCSPPRLFLHTSKEDELILRELAGSIFQLELTDACHELDREGWITLR